MQPYDAVGWFGVMFILLAYGLITYGTLVATDISYIAMNIIGSGGIIWSSYMKRDFQPVALNIIWILIALVGLVRVIN